MAGQTAVLNFRGMLEEGMEDQEQEEEPVIPLQAQRAPRENKKCSGCHDVKPIAEFHKSKRRFDGYQAYCKPCCQKLHTTWRDSRPAVAPCVTRKFCGGCKLEKAASEFHKDRKRTDGLQCQCKACTTLLHKKWRDERKRADRPVAERKACRACAETKPAEEFGRDARAADGLQSRCKVCNTQYFNLWAAQRRLAKNPGIARRKTCGICGEEKLAEEFRLAREGTSEDRLVANCKDCTNAKRPRDSSDSEAEPAQQQRRPGVLQLRPAAAPTTVVRARARPVAAAARPARRGSGGIPVSPAGRGAAFSGAAAGSGGSDEPPPADSPLFGSLQEQVMGSDEPWQQALNLSLDFSTGL
ncbi:hypothetical protein COCSUDRAFT_57208 [Coccomyxa subellipsoidea C-169]|uniref:Stc1 domain-containing protein n=1 Tax=Coccomyxa subellipsoidea (strain C-169) TaxID=574566 RepID=I0YQH0_COCSC|nr:hypothetical protein COCSUDRAFT_57208 [Coccomyxa subellipsoidea C-169]EIE20639.1 hypothetical protein COCSUDRAFT_57208 [Coccomyxa subellipsoidea C-169]|eukprot:XP_005645183.1 hypothetical protein COCSUDRAFT_57208 [Coccomyxa subellipsoidea C-169]